MADVVENLGTFQQRLGGNASPVQAYTTQFGLFNHGGFHSELRGADGGNIPSGTTTDNNEIVFHYAMFF